MAEEATKMSRTDHSRKPRNRSSIDWWWDNTSLRSTLRRGELPKDKAIKEQLTAILDEDGPANYYAASGWDNGVERVSYLEECGEVSDRTPYPLVLRAESRGYADPEPDCETPDVEQADLRLWPEFTKEDDDELSASGFPPLFTLEQAREQLGSFIIIEPDIDGNEVQVA